MAKQNFFAELFTNIQIRRESYQKLIALDDELMNSQLTKAIWGE